ncbi:MAG TPA: hypothetical protein VGG19_02095 [Tepidisphaeraceae bacterium]|jgi:hypothetical protein
MAKGKNAAALFEVIGSSRPGESAPSPTRTPNWWWKRPAASDSSGTSAAGASAVRVDRDHQLVHFTLTTTTSLLIAFGILVALGIAFILGEHVGRNRTPMTAVTSDSLIKSVPNPQVMDVPSGANAPANQTEQTTDEQTTNQQSTQTPTAQAPSTADRQVGLYYVIMQSYPPDMRSYAVEAQTALLTHSVPCTIEDTPARLHPKGWISVIGTSGFPSIKSAEAKNYIHQIEQANADLHGKFKKLNPVAYRWR